MIVITLISSNNYNPIKTVITIAVKILVASIVCKVILLKHVADTAVDIPLAI